MSGYRMPWRALVAALGGVMAVTIPCAAQTWVPTSTQGLGMLLANATSLGPMPASASLHVAVAMQLNNKSALLQYLQTISDPSSAIYGNFLTVDQFVASYAPSAAQVQAVVNYLSANGFTNIQAEPNNLFVTADGTAAQAGVAFNTGIGQFQQNGVSVYANYTDTQVPSSLAGTVAAVLGLNNVGRMAPPIHKASSATATPSVHFYTPQNFWTAYDVGAIPAAAKTNIAIFAEGDLTQVLKNFPPLKNT